MAWGAQPCALLFQHRVIGSLYCLWAASAFICPARCGKLIEYRLVGGDIRWAQNGNDRRRLARRTTARSPASQSANSPVVSRLGKAQLLPGSLNAGLAAGRALVGAEPRGVTTGQRCLRLALALVGNPDFPLDAGAMRTSVIPAIGPPAAMKLPQRGRRSQIVVPETVIERGPAKAAIGEGLAGGVE